MRKSLVIVVLATVFFFFAFGSVFAQRAGGGVVNVRLASPLPANSEWGRALNRLAAEWRQVTNGQVNVVVSHDGREGSEADMLRKLYGNSIQVAIFTSAGIAEICPAIMNLSVPFMIKNEAELDAVLAEVVPILNTRVRDEFVVLAWSKGGWVYLFSRENVLVPADLRRQRLATSPDLKDMNTVFRNMGFQLTEVDVVDLGQRLATGIVNATYVIPAVVAPMQLHRSLNHMLDLPIAPVMGAIVINRVTWNRLTPATQQQLIRTTQIMAADFDTSMARTEAAAIAAMGRDGLSVNKPSAAQEEIWSTELNAIMPSLIGSIFDRELNDRINEILERARRGQ